MSTTTKKKTTSSTLARRTGPKPRAAESSSYQLTTRLTEEERANLAAHAGDEPLSSFAREKLFEHGYLSPPKGKRRAS